MSQISRDDERLDNVIVDEATNRCQYCHTTLTFHEFELHTRCCMECFQMISKNRADDDRDDLLSGGDSPKDDDSVDGLYEDESDADDTDDADWNGLYDDADDWFDWDDALADDYEEDYWYG